MLHSENIRTPYLILLKSIIHRSLSHKFFNAIAKSFFVAHKLSELRLFIIRRIETKAHNSHNNSHKHCHTFCLFRSWVQCHLHQKLDKILLAISVSPILNWKLKFQGKWRVTCDIQLHWWELQAKYLWWILCFNNSRLIQNNTKKNNYVISWYLR